MSTGTWQKGCGQRIRSPKSNETLQASHLQALGGQQGFHLCSDLHEAPSRLNEPDREAQDTQHPDSENGAVRAAFSLQIQDGYPRMQTLKLPPSNTSKHHAVSTQLSFLQNSPPLITSESPKKEGTQKRQKATSIVSHFLITSTQHQVRQVSWGLL